MFESSDTTTFLLCSLLFFVNFSTTNHSTNDVLMNENVCIIYSFNGNVQFTNIK